jgi:putative nucleotidyltransferase with HDIG domain
MSVFDLIDAQGRCTMDGNTGFDLTGEALKTERFHLLEDIAADLSEGELVFPVCFELHQRIRAMLDDPELSLEQLAVQITLEPLIDAKLLRLVNSVAYRRDGPEVVDIKTAILHLGVRAVRNVALAVTMNQLQQTSAVAEFESMAADLWRHSLQTACAAEILARRKTRINPDEAMLAGLVHDIGAFYMLHRATQYEDLRRRPDTLRYLIVRWHESIGESVLFALDMPEEIIEAVREHDQTREIFGPIRKFSDVIYVANLLAGGLFEWQFRDEEIEPALLQSVVEQYRDLEDEIHARSAELVRILG